MLQLSSPDFSFLIIGLGVVDNPYFYPIENRIPAFSFDPDSSSISSIGAAKKAFGKGSTRGQPFIAFASRNCAWALGEPRLTSSGRRHF